MPVPLNWGDNAADASVKNNAVDGGIKIVVVKNRGTGIGTANQTYTRVPIKGDGFNAECTVVVNNDAQIESVTVSNEGFGYTYGNVDLELLDLFQHLHLHQLLMLLSHHQWSWF